MLFLMPIIDLTRELANFLPGKTVNGLNQWAVLWASSSMFYICRL